jgi:hypothetical protein
VPPLRGKAAARTAVVRASPAEPFQATRFRRALSHRGPGRRGRRTPRRARRTGVRSDARSRPKIIRTRGGGSRREDARRVTRHPGPVVRVDDRSCTLDRGPRAERDRGPRFSSASRIPEGHACSPGGRGPGSRNGPDRLGAGRPRARPILFGRVIQRSKYVSWVILHVRASVKSPVTSKPKARSKPLPS